MYTQRVTHIILIAYYVVVNDSVFAFVGDSVVVREDIRVTIDCGRLIDDSVINNGIQNPLVTWYDNFGNSVNNRHTNYTEISVDGRQFTLTISSNIGGAAFFRLDGNYTCEVCSRQRTCINRTTTIYICGENDFGMPLIMLSRFLSFR